MPRASRESHRPRRRKIGGPRCLEHRGALLLFASAEDLAPRLAKHVWTSAAHFSRLTRFAPESRHDFDLSAVQISGLPGNDRPLTHTVTLRLARSFGLARWRHSISSPRLLQRTPCPRRLLAPRSGANSRRTREPRSLTLSAGAALQNIGCELARRQVRGGCAAIKPWA